MGKVWKKVKESEVNGALCSSGRVKAW